MKPPIADPFAPPMADEDTRVFPQSFWRVYRGNLLFALLFGGTLLLFWPLSRAIFSQGNGGFVLFFILILNPLVTALSAVFLHPVRVNRAGVQGPPGVGFVAWEQMKSARALWLGLLYVRIRARNHLFALWIPLALSDKTAFAQTIEEWAPADNPLRLWLQKRNF